LAQLRGLAAHAPDEGLARHSSGLVGAGRLGSDQFRFLGCEYVFERFTQLRNALNLVGLIGVFESV
jgi:hypothetical protein